MKKKRFPGWTFLLLPLLFSCTAGSAKGTSDTATLYERAAGIFQNLITISSLTSVITTANVQPLFSSREKQYHMELSESFGEKSTTYVYDFSSHYYFHSHIEKKTSASEPALTQDYYLYQNETTGVYFNVSDNSGMRSEFTYTVFNDFITQFAYSVLSKNMVIALAQEALFTYLQILSEESWAEASTSSVASSGEKNEIRFTGSSTGAGSLALDAHLDQSYGMQETLADYHYVFKDGRFISFDGTGKRTVTSDSGPVSEEGVFHASADYSQCQKSYPKAQ